jgi:serine/threonine protein kinase
VDLLAPNFDQQLEQLELLDVDDGRWIGRLIDGRYRLTRKLGEGGMAAVYAARCFDGSEVAVKILHPRMSGDPEARRRFFWEVCISTNLRHPNVVEIFDFGNVEGGGFYMAMEYLDGETLAERAERQALTYGEILDVALAVCDVLQAAHAQGVIHRDLKPGNVYLARRPDGSIVPKVIDFGIAKQTGADVTGLGIVYGTPAYMSPEQAAGKTSTEAADLFALGAMLYRLICGDAPFEGSTPVEIALAHLHSLPKSLRRGRGVKSIPPQLEWLITRLLDKDPGRRPASALAVWRHLVDLRDSADEVLLARIPVRERPRRRPSQVFNQETVPTRGARRNRAWSRARHFVRQLRRRVSFGTGL